MKEKDIILTEMLNASIRNEEFLIDKYKSKSIDWDEIYAQALAHQVHILIYPIVKKIDPQMGPNTKLMVLWNISVMSCGIQIICDEVWIGEVIETFYTLGIKAIVLKDMAINKCCPYPELRTMGDVDILINEKDMDIATEVLKKGIYSSQESKN